MKYFGTSRKFHRTSGFLLATCPGQVAEKKILITTALPFDAHEQDTWRSGVKSAMCTASLLLGSGPLMWMLPLRLHVNKNLGPVVQSIVSLTSSLRGQLVKCFTTS